MVRVAVVTGSNKGIGYAIVRGLCKQFKGIVYLTARNAELGHKAVGELQKEGLDPKFHQLDIEDQKSVETLKKYLVDKYGGLDVLVNNAAMAYKESSTAPFTEQAEVTLRINFFSTLNVCGILFPILRPHARVVHVASFAGKMAYDKCSEEIKKKLINCKTITDVERCMNQFVQDVKEGPFKERGWPQTAYGMSKLGILLVTPIQQAELDCENSRPDVIVNDCCPGYVNTDMSSGKGHLTIDQGADTPVYLSLIPENVREPKGLFVKNRAVVDWH